MKINRIRATIIATLSFSLKMSINAISFYWRNDTPRFVTWRSRQATALDTSTCIVIHGGQFIGGVHPPDHFVPEIVSPLPCSPALVRHTLLIVYFFKELISFTGSPDKCHTSVFNSFISYSIHITKQADDIKRHVLSGLLLISRVHHKNFLIGEVIRPPTVLSLKADCLRNCSLHHSFLRNCSDTQSVSSWFL